MPLVRATITIQNPSCELKSTTEAISHIYKTRGLSGLWHGVSAGILKVGRTLLILILDAAAHCGGVAECTQIYYCGCG
jgi:hypothetical protein